MTQIILNPVGRPRKRYEVCPYPNCGQPCFFYTISVKKSEKNYSYIRSRHYDKTLKDHYIGKKIQVKKPRYAIEYNRALKKTPVFSFQPHLKRFDYLNSSPIDSNINTVLPIVVYDFGIKIIPEQINYELKKLNGLKVSEKEIDWLLRQKQVKRGQASVREFYKKLLNILKAGYVVTFGEKAVKVGDRIGSLESFTGNITYFFDKYGMLVKILETREKRKMLSDSCSKKYDYPPGTL